MKSFGFLEIEYLLASAFMKILTLAVILKVTYSDTNVPIYFSWLFLGMTLIWALYPFYESLREKEK